jgi:hypothetical protein
MSKLWVFGDSCSSNLTELRTNSMIEDFIQKFNNGKDYEIWYETVARELGMESQSLGKSGSCNYGIFERICENFDLINEDDIVIINWSVLERYRIGIGDRKQDYLTILATYMNEKHGQWLYEQTKKMLDVADVTIESVVEIGYNRSKSKELFQNEINSWSYFIYSYFKSKNIKVIFWGLTEEQNYYFMSAYPPVIEKRGLIVHETNNEIQDWHFGVTGNKIFAEYVIQKIKSENLDLPKELFFTPHRSAPHPLKKKMV